MYNFCYLFERREVGVNSFNHRITPLLIIQPSCSSTDSGEARNQYILVLLPINVPEKGTFLFSPSHKLAFSVLERAYINPIPPPRAQACGSRLGVGEAVSSRSAGKAGIPPPSRYLREPRVLARFQKDANSIAAYLPAIAKLGSII